VGMIGTAQLIDDTADIDDQYVRTYRRSYLAFSTTDKDAAYVRNNIGIGIGATHPSDSQALCKRITVKLAAKNMGFYDSFTNIAMAVTPPANGTECYVWQADVEWGLWNPQTHTATGDPADTPLQVFFESQTFEEISDVDINGNPVVNSAYSYFDPPVTRDRTRPNIRVVRMEDSFSDSTILGYADKVNSDVVGDYPVRTLKCAAPTAETLYSQFTGAKYYKVTYLLAYNPDTWDKVLLDQGLEELDPSDATKRRKIFVENQPASSPQLLDGSGHYLAPPVTSSNVNYLTYQVYDTLNYASAFGFPSGTFN
jgi:hypothetical protein